MQDMTPQGFGLQEIQIYEQVVVLNAIPQVERAPNGSRILRMTLLNGRQYVFPITNPEVAKNIGMELAAPGIVPPYNSASEPG